MRIEKDQHEQFAKFFSEPSRESLRDLIKNTVGEADHLDFKEAWPDIVKLAKHALSIANSGGGAIIVGIRQTEEGKLDACGASPLLDKAELAIGLQRYLPKSLKYFVIDFHYNASDYDDLKGKSFQVFLVEGDAKQLPFLSLSDGSDIRKNAIYVRSGTSSREADHDELQQLINTRIETGHSSQGALELTKHLQQLRALDEFRPGNDSWLSQFFQHVQSERDDQESSDFKEFLEDAYESKKALVYRELGLRT
jgi:predicted HTH transcriptional regulator